VAGSDRLMGFYTPYKTVFDAVKAAIATKATIKTVVLGEQFTVGGLPKAIINAEPASIGPAEMGAMLDVKINFSVVLVILEYEPKDWFTDIISVMGDVVDAVLSDRTLAGAAKDCIPTGFAPGEIKFQDKVFYGGAVRFQAVMWHAP
jgi:hypothetical protein